MNVRSRVWHRALMLAAAFYFASPAHATIAYTISLSHPERHIFEVTMRIPDVRDQVTVADARLERSLSDSRFFFPHDAGQRDG